MRSCVQTLLILLLSSLTGFVAAATPLLPNDILVTGAGVVGQGLIRIDRESGAQTLISAGNYGDFQIVGQTVYALSGDSVVAIDAGSGSLETIASGDLIGAVGSVGLAVGTTGDVFVAGAGGIARIDAVSRQQSLLVSAAELDDSYTLIVLIPGEQNSQIVDLEMGAEGNPIALSQLRVSTSWVAEVSVLSGQMNVLFDRLQIGPASNWGILATGLGISPDGLIVASDGGPNTTGIAAYDPTTGAASLIGSNVFGSVDSNGNYRAVELLSSDVAIDSLGTRWIVGDAAASPIDGLFRNWRMEDDGTPFSAGHFNEIQIVSEPIPEPSAAVLIGLGLAGLARSNRRSTVF